MGPSAVTDYPSMIAHGFDASSPPANAITDDLREVLPARDHGVSRNLLPGGRSPGDVVIYGVLGLNLVVVIYGVRHESTGENQDIHGKSIKYFVQWS